jgi:hypothetical protein
MMPRCCCRNMDLSAGQTVVLRPVTGLFLTIERRVNFISRVHSIIIIAKNCQDAIYLMPTLTLIFIIISGLY